MLLDEPFSALDTGLRASTRKAVARLLADSGVTTLLVTHDQEEALSIADQIAVMRDGRFTQVGAPQDVYRRPNDRFTAEFLGDCIALPCSVASGVAQCALGRVPVQTSIDDGPATLALRPEQLVATVISDSTADVGTSECSDGVGTVVATEFLGHDVLLTIDPAGDIAPIIVRQHSLDPPPIDAKVRIEVIGSGVALR
jgi:iron(III) transport system ATP-binding protein